MESQITSVRDIDDGGALGTSVELHGGRRRLVLTRKGGEVRVFLNSCPHTGVRLDWIPGRFMDLNDKFLQCATHGALFEPDSGYCVEGPCAGQYLTELPCKLRNGIVYIDTESEAPRFAIIQENEE